MERIGPRGVEIQSKTSARPPQGGRRGGIQPGVFFVPLCLCGILTLLLSWPIEAFAQEKAPAAEPEKKQEEKKADGFNVKAPLVESLTIGGQIRLRGEVKDVASYPAAPATMDPKPSSDTIAERVRLHLDAAVVKNLRAFVQIQDSRTWGDESSVGSLNADSAELMLKQGFLEVLNIGDVPFSVKAGRIEVPNLGDQRLIGSLEWDNVGRSWDGILLNSAPYGWRILGFGALTRDVNAMGCG